MGEYRVGKGIIFIANTFALDIYYIIFPSNRYLFCSSSFKTEEELSYYLYLFFIC